MGFCVFGVTEELASKEARKKVVALQCNALCSDSEINAKVAPIAAINYQKMKPRQISPVFDAPQFCDTWLEICQKSLKCRDLIVMAYQEKKGKNGLPEKSKATGKIRMIWIPYQK